MNNLTNNITSFSKKFILTVHHLQMIKDIIYLTCPLLLENHFPGCKIGDRRKESSVSTIIVDVIMGNSSKRWERRINYTR